MAFLNEFQKEAGIASGIGKAIGAPVAAAQSAAKALGKRRRITLGGVKKGLTEASEEFGPKARAAGLGERRVQKAVAQSEENVKAHKAGLIVPEKHQSPAPMMSGDVSQIKQKAKEDLTSRYARMKKKNLGPSFASKHPVLTTAAGIGAYHMMTRPQKDDDRPAIVYPQ